MPELPYHIFAVSALLNIWLLLYSIPKLRREREYWKRRSVWYERYLDDVYEGNGNITVKPLETDPGDKEKSSQ